MWKRAGLTGLISGLDLREALLALPLRCDRAFATRLLVIAEREYLSAAMALEEQKKEGGDGK